MLPAHLAPTTPFNIYAVQWLTVSSSCLIQLGTLESKDKKSYAATAKDGHRTDAAWTRAELADVENEDIKVRYAGKR